MWLVEVAIRDVSFENIIVTGAVHAGLIHGVQKPSSANLKLTQVKECKSVLANPLEEDSLKFHAAVPSLLSEAAGANLSEAAGPSSANLRLTQVKECKSVLANPLEEDSLKFHAAVPCVQNDLLKGLSFKNVTFLPPPTHGWSCKYVAGDFLAKLVSPPLEC